jgi:Flp pilus assembly protein TadG
MPAGVLVVVVLGCIAVDLSIAYLGHRELAAAAASAANDAVTFGVDEAAYRQDGTYVLDPARVRRAVSDAVTAQRPPVHDLRIDVEVAGSQVTVTLSASVSYLFAGAIPGAPDGSHVVARAIAVAQSP